MTRRGRGRRGSMAMRVPLSTEPGEVPRVRQMVRATLHSWGLADSEVTLLLVSELVTNALLHGLPPLELRLSADGIEIVAALASRWGSAAAPTGKVVWFEVDPAGSR